MTAIPGAPAIVAARPVATRRFRGVHPLLFAAYPVLFLWSQNLGETDIGDALPPLVFIPAVAVGLTLVLGRLLGDVRRGALVVTPFALALLMYGHVGSYLSTFGIGALLQPIGWGLVLVLVLVAAIRLDERWVARLDWALVRIGAILVAITLIQILPFTAGSAGAPVAAEEVAPQPDTTTAQKRDVYWLIFDRYGSDRSLDLLYGIENDLTPWLKKQGFTVLADSHANYVRTALSLSTTLNMRHLRDMPDLPGPGSSDLRPVHAKLGSSLVARQFKELGYTYYHVGSWWGPSRRDPIADVNLDLAGPSDFQATLYDESAIPFLLRRVGIGVVDSRERHYRNNEFGLDALGKLRDEPGPKFVFGHVLIPHPPLVYDRDGTFMTAEQTAALSPAERFERQLAYGNTRLREILAGLLALPEEKRPIIILQADEGPAFQGYRSTTYDWTNATDRDIEIKFGILNAWYLPGGEDLGLRQDQTSINTFPTLFTRYFGLDYDQLPEPIYTSKRWTLPYDLNEVTDRLPSLR